MNLALLILDAHLDDGSMESVVLISCEFERFMGLPVLAKMA
jgi:hypothetical protein